MPNDPVSYSWSRFTFFICRREYARVSEWMDGVWLASAHAVDFQYGNRWCSVGGGGIRINVGYTYYMGD